MKQESWPSEPTNSRDGQPDEIRFPGHVWVKHQANLYDLISEYHEVDLRENTQRQQDILRQQLSCRDPEVAKRLKEELEGIQNLIWGVGEKERTRVVPRVPNIEEAEDVLFRISNGEHDLVLDPIMDADKRAVGGWAELVLHEDRYNRPGKEEEEAYGRLAKWLKKNNKVRYLL